jgi:SAM-dependent methyltransferase
MDARQVAALGHVDLAGQGLEIGPSYSPLVPKSMQPTIDTVDHASRSDLIEKYVLFGLPQDKIDTIDEVDYIWDGGSLVDAIGKKEHYDYVVAAHVVEHSVDLIAFLRDCEALLKPEGRLVLVVPDKRVCFDFFKPLTSLGDAIDAHLRPTTFHPPGAFVDHVAYACMLDGQIAWSPGQHGDLAVQFADLSSVPTQIQQAVDQSAYRDIHRWIFTPASFSLLMQDLAELGYHSFVEVGSAPTSGYEFYITLAKAPLPVASRPRTESLLRIRDEIREEVAGDLLLELQESSSRLSRVDHELTNARGDLEEIRASTSWRITKPLRAVASRLRR